MAFEKSNQKMCNLMAKVMYIFADTFVNPPSLLRQNDDVMMRVMSDE